MSFLGDLVGGTIGFLAGGPVGAAIGAGLGSAATGGNIQQDLMAAGGAYGLGTLGAGLGFGPATTAAGGTAAGIADATAASGALGSAFGIAGDASTITGLADSTFGSVSGASPFVAGAGAGAGGTSPFLSGDLGLGSDITTAGVMSGATPGLDVAGVGGLSATQLGSALSSGTLGDLAAGADPAALVNVTGSQDSAGMLSKFLNWAKDPKNGQLAAAMVQTVGGLLKGIGTAANQRDMAQYQQQLAEQLAQWQRSFTQSGDYWGAKVGISPSGRALTRPSGAPVYGSGGLISNALALQ